MAKYRKKPVVIEAYRLLPESADWLATWCGGRVNRDTKPSDPTDESITLSIPTLEGVMTAQEGDFVIKGVKGEFYPIKESIFRETYEPVEED